MKNSISRPRAERKRGLSAAIDPKPVICKLGPVFRRAFDKSWLTTSAGLFVVLLLVTLAVALRPASAAAGAVNITALGTPFTQNFDTLVSSGSGTWTNDSTIPGWYHARTGTGTTIVANDGSSNAGNLYSYGTGTNTDRALGSVGSGNAAAGNFFWGVRLSNQTGGTITSLLVSYVGEEWRNSAAAAQTVAFSYLIGNNLGGSLADFQAVGVNVTQLDFTSPITGGAASALNGNLAANRVAISFTINGLSLANGGEMLLRWSDPDHTGSDHGLAIDDFSVTANGTGGGGVSLSINDVTMAEGNAGTTTATFTVSLSAAAPAGGVTFDIATADNTATVADNDYVARSLLAQNIPQGGQTFNFAVTVNGDTTPEPNETFFVNVTNVTGTGATVADGQGLGTLTNDDFSSIPIHTVQGSGTNSPFAGQVVTVTGIVTGVKTNGFFIQAPDAEADADPNTSEGVFVFTSSTPPAAAAAGNSVAVMGAVQEFIPSSDLNSPPATEIAGSPTVNLLSTGNPLPAPITLTAADTSPAGSIQQLEKFEGMRVHVNSLTAIAPTQGTVSEPNATSTSNGVFYGVITGLARPFREPGLETPDPAPAGSPCCIPRFDANPERLRVDADGQVGGLALEVTTGATVTNLTGPLDYAFRTYTILPDPPPATQPGVSGNISAIPVPVPDADEFTVGSFNMERFFDTVDDPGVSDVALTVTAFNNRLNKASLAIRNVMRTPDIIGIEEMENLTTLQAVATKVNNDAVAAAQPNPNYQAFLVEGNDIGGIDVGFLVKTARVSVIDVTQVGKDTMYTEPGGAMALLNDRPSLVLRAAITSPSSPKHGAVPSLTITVIVNHLRSLSGVDDPADGNRVRTKRRAQAEFLANLIQARQAADPTERIVSVGDYNAFQFNDGYGDSIGTIKGTPTPASEVVLASSDLVNPNLIDLLDAVPPDQRYSFSFDGNAQVLDHELVNASLMPYFSRIAYARNNGDFPESLRNDANRPERISDHDMAVGFFKFTPQACSFSLSPAIQPFTAAGGGGSAAVTTGLACTWTAASNVAWIIITSESAAAGNETTTFEVKENMSDAPRTGTLTIAGQTFTVVQDGAAIACAYSISPTSQSFKTPSAGGGTVNVTATTGCGWLATSNASWITITSGNSGVGDGTVSYTVAVNTGPTRGGTITVAGRLFTVKQKGN